MDEQQAGVCMSRSLAFAVTIVLVPVVLMGCATPPTVGSLAVDRASEVVDGIVTAPTADQKKTFVRVLVREYQNLGFPFSESDLAASERAEIINAAIKTCRELAEGVSVTTMRKKMQQDLLQQSPNLDSATASGIISANFTAIRAPGSLCP